MKTVAVIQARMGSSRLAGKAMMDICGAPMLGRVISRIKICSLIEDLVVATTIEKKDDPIEQFCHKKNILCFRGSENDVLDRYYQSAVKFAADVIVRITCDCPLIDPHVTDQVIAAYLKDTSNISGASNVVDRAYPRGLDTEVISFHALEQVWEKATQSHQREHVTAFIYEHPELFKMLSIKHDKNLSHLRWTVDEEDDLSFVREVYRAMAERGKEQFYLNDIVELLKQKPDLIKINSAVRQKAIH